MLARHAESLFWTGRYIERAEDTGRLLDVTYHGLLEATPFEARRAWRDLLSVLRLGAEFDEAHARELTASGVSEFLVLDRTNPGSIVSSVGRARENVRSLRELVSTEMWEAINGFHLELRARNLRADLEQPYVLYNLVKRRCQSLAGVAVETMARDDGWRFLQIGWMLERAEMMCRLLDVRYGRAATATAGIHHHWVGTLKSASASEAYRKAHRASLDPTDVVEFLLLSRTFPRSVLFCLRRVEQDLQRLGPGEGRLSRPERLLGRIRADLEYADLHEVIGRGPGAGPDQPDLHAFLERIQRGVRQVAESVALQYFRNAEEVGLTVLDFHPPG